MTKNKSFNISYLNLAAQSPSLELNLAFSEKIHLENNRDKHVFFMCDRALKSCSVNVAIAAWPWGTYLGDEGLNNGIKVKTSSYSRHHVNSALVRAKACGYYINSILAHQEVARYGYDEALILDTEGYVSEGAGENIFIVKKNILYTTDLSTCLEGITRDTVISLSKELNLSLIEKRITRDEIYSAEEAFFTGTAAEITPITSLDDRLIGSGKRGSITKKLQDLFFDIVNGNSQLYKNWLTYL